MEHSNDGAVVIASRLALLSRRLRLIGIYIVVGALANIGLTVYAIYGYGRSYNEPVRAVYPLVGSSALVFLILLALVFFDLIRKRGEIFLAELSDLYTEVVPGELRISFYIREFNFSDQTFRV